MARIERILDRLRPVGAPGTAAAAGVPADRVAELAAELDPVLTRLDAVQERCRHIRADAAAEAGRRRRAAAEQARQLVTEAHRASEAARGEAAATLERSVAAEGAASRRTATLEAAAVRALTAKRVDALVGRVMDEVRAFGGTAGPAGQAPAGSGGRPGGARR